MPRTPQPKPFILEGQIEIKNTQSPETLAMRSVIARIEKMLVAKNEQYGSSVFDPVRVFSDADTIEQIKVRIDDKISRLQRGNASMEADDDVIEDLIGYLVILLAAKELKK